MAAGSAWVLNLDADLELAASASGKNYAPTLSVREAMKAMTPVVAASLLRAEDLVIDDTTPSLTMRGRVGRAFCPTPRAIALLRRAGADPAPHPPLEVIRRVNSRAFAASLGATLPSASFVTDFAVARALFDLVPEVGDAWRAKRAFGMAGRGQRIVAVGAPSDADLAFVRSCIGEGGVQIEPNVPIVREVAIHGLIAPPDEGSKITWGRLVLQECDARGAWVATRTLADPSPLEATLIDEAARVGDALVRAGYFGPFGVDAYTYRDRAGAICFQSRGEINARYSMGFGVGFG